MDGRQLAMASELMANGNIIKYVKTHRDANRFELVGFSTTHSILYKLVWLLQLTDVARGLIYMHGEGIIHGDLKGVGVQIQTLIPRCFLMFFFKANILIDQGGHARLADFGLIAIVSETGNSLTTNPSAGLGTMRWMSPELFVQEHSAYQGGQRTGASDCYALGMVIFEVLSDQIPFAPYHDHAVQWEIGKGEHPERSKRSWFTDELWEKLHLCWSFQPTNRPPIKDVFKFLGLLSPTWEPLPPDMKIGVVNTEDVPTIKPTGRDGDSSGSKYPFCPKWKFRHL
jgi:serine/threonine protein kinase